MFVPSTKHWWDAANLSSRLHVQYCQVSRVALHSLTVYIKQDSELTALLFFLCSAVSQRRSVKPTHDHFHRSSVTHRTMVGFNTDYLCYGFSFKVYCRSVKCVIVLSSWTHMNSTIIRNLQVGNFFALQVVGMPVRKHAGFIRCKVCSLHRLLVSAAKPPAKWSSGRIPHSLSHDPGSIPNPGSSPSH